LAIEGFTKDVDEALWKTLSNDRLKTSKRNVNLGVT